MWKPVWPKPDRPDHLLRPWFIDPTEGPIQVFGTLVLKSMSDVRCGPSLVRSCTRMEPIATFGPHMLGLCVVMTTINSIARGMQCVGKTAHEVVHVTWVRPIIPIIPGFSPLPIIPKIIPEYSAQA